MKRLKTMLNTRSKSTLNQQEVKIQRKFLSKMPIHCLHFCFSLLYTCSPIPILALLSASRRYQFWLCYLFCCLYWGILASSLFIFILLAILSFYFLLLAMFDTDYFLLPDNMTFGLLALGFILNSTPYQIVTLENVFNGFLLGVGLFYSIYLLGYFLYQECILGFGDIKLIGAITAWCGVDLLLYILLLSSLLGIVIYIGTYIKTKEHVNKIAFGSCLSFSTLIILGNEITLKSTLLFLNFY